MLIDALPRNELLRSGLIILGFIILAYVIHVILRTVVRKLTEKTKTDLDDKLLAIIVRPLYALIILSGLHVALRTLSLLEPYISKIEDVTFILFVLIISYSISRIVALLVGRWLKAQQGMEKTPMLVGKGISIIVYIIGILMILAHFRVEIIPIIATLGIGGLAIGLALQSTLANLFAGLYLISDGPIAVGNFIELEDGKIAGYVEDIAWRSTRIRTIYHNIIIIPNTKLAESIITNTCLPQQEIAVPVQCGVSYDSDLKKVEKATVEVARIIQKTAEGTIKSFEPTMRFHTFADSNINFEVMLRVRRFEDKKPVVHEFIKALKERYDKKGIEISWPVRKVYQAK